MQSDLWNHALALYARPGVEAACLELQRQGGDVCLLLCATWLQARAVPFSDERAHVLQGCAGRWQREVVAPLRSLRQQWREAAGSDSQLALLREQLKGMELQAEKTLLHRLQVCAAQWPCGSSAGAGDWLARLAPGSARGHDALDRLRAAARAYQEAEDEV